MNHLDVLIESIEWIIKNSSIDPQTGNYSKSYNEAIRKVIAHGFDSYDSLVHCWTMTDQITWLVDEIRWSNFKKSIVAGL